jgi:hypothetical protein
VPHPRHAVVVFLGGRRGSLIGSGSGRYGRVVRVAVRLAHTYGGHPIHPAAHRGDFVGHHLGGTRHRLEFLHIRRQLLGHVPHALLQKRSARRHQAHRSHRAPHLAAVAVAGQFADDPGQVWRHVLDDPGAQLDRLDRWAVVHAHQPVERLFDMMRAPAPVILGARRLLEPTIALALHDDLRISRDQILEILVLVQPQHPARHLTGGRILLLERQLRAVATAHLSAHQLHQPAKGLVPRIDLWDLDVAGHGIASVGLENHEGDPVPRSFQLSIGLRQAPIGVPRGLRPAADTRSAQDRIRPGADGATKSVQRRLPCWGRPSPAPPLIVPVVCDRPAGAVRGYSDPRARHRPTWARAIVRSACAPWPDPGARHRPI